MAVVIHLVLFFTILQVGMQANTLLLLIHSVASLDLAPPSLAFDAQLPTAN